CRRIDRQCRKLAVAHEWKGNGDRSEKIIDTSGHHFTQYLRRSLEWHVYGLDSRTGVEPDCTQVGRGADARRGKIERAGFRPGSPDQIGSGLETLRGRCEQHARYDAKRRHRRKIARNIVVESRKKRWRERLRGGIGKQG